MKQVLLFFGSICHVGMLFFMTETRTSAGLWVNGEAFVQSSSLGEDDVVFPGLFEELLMGYEASMAIPQIPSLSEIPRSILM